MGLTSLASRVGGLGNAISEEALTPLSGEAMNPVSLVGVCLRAEGTSSPGIDGPVLPAAAASLNSPVEGTVTVSRPTLSRRIPDRDDSLGGRNGV